MTRRRNRVTRRREVCRVARAATASITARRGAKGTSHYDANKLHYKSADHGRHSDRRAAAREADKLLASIS